MAEAHDSTFFEQMRTRREPYRRLANCIHNVLGVQTALDIGCGIGLQTKRLMELGWSVVGADYAPAARELREPGVEIEYFDLTAPLILAGTDVRATVICTETAEHIPAEHADTIVANVARLAKRYIVWSAAVPGQEWPGHVNLQPPSYWLTRFAHRGWVPDNRKTELLRELMRATDAQHVGAADNFFVLVPGTPPRPLHMTITSTALNAEKWSGRCVRSVCKQTFENWTHYYIDAASTDDTVYNARVTDERLVVRVNEIRKAALENAWDVWVTLPDDEVIVWLDGDDWLAHDRALEVVAAAYEHPSEPWLTYGQFMQTDGTVGFASRYPAGALVRKMDWRATHLKTFRAGLVKRIRDEDLQQPDGSWIDVGIDQAIMLPVLEMAAERARFCPRILVVYNDGHSFGAAATPAEIAREHAEVARIRSQSRYARLDDL